MRSIKIFVIFIVMFLILTLNVFAGEMDISASSLEYVENCERINAKGNVVLNWDDKKIYADYVEFGIDKKIMNACGNVTIEENGSVMRADSVSYNYDDGTGDTQKAFVHSSAIFMRAKSMERQGNGTFVIKDIKLSNCDHDDPHAYFKSKSGKLVLKKRITIYNAVLYAGKTPIFYFPIFTKSLSGNRFGQNLKIEPEPGFTSSSGPSLKNTLSCSLSETITGKLMYDYLGKRGDGYGGEIIWLTDEIELYVYGYKTFNDWVDEREKWTLRSSYFHRLNDLWTIRANAEFQNSISLLQRVWSAGRLRSYASITRQERRANLTTCFEHNEDYNSVTDNYKKSSEKLPEIKLDFFAREVFMGIYHYPSFRYSYHYAQHDNKNNKKFYRNTSLLKYVLFRDYRLSKRLVLTPSLKVTENWYDIDNKGKNKNGIFTQYGGKLNLRFRATDWMNWNTSYEYR